MAILSGRSRQHLSIAAVVMALMCVAGCMLAGSFAPGARRFAFSHARHVGEEKLACQSCHAEAQRSPQPGMPTPDACSVCHDELDAEKPPGQRVAELFDGEAFRAGHAMKVDSEIVFDHQAHARGVEGCASCHAAIESNAAVVADLALTMDDCTSCHQERAVPSDCATCHREIRAETAPISHASDWRRRHGRCAREGEAIVDRCELCHREETCVRCHRIEAPDNHVPHWLLRGHGATAMLDRGNCAACHQADSCVRCHRETTPVSHVGSFGAPRDTHCFSCHFPLNSQGCAACHSGTPSHRSATPKPNDPFHTSGMNCRQCHDVTVPLEHVDNGDDCNACHH